MQETGFYLLFWFYICISLTLKKVLLSNEINIVIFYIYIYFWEQFEVLLYS